MASLKATQRENRPADRLLMKPQVAGLIDSCARQSCTWEGAPICPARGARRVSVAGPSETFQSWSAELPGVFPGMLQELRSCGVPFSNQPRWTERSVLWKMFLTCLCVCLTWLVKFSGQNHCLVCVAEGGLIPRCFLRPQE